MGGLAYPQSGLDQGRAASIPFRSYRQQTKESSDTRFCREGGGRYFVADCGFGRAKCLATILFHFGGKGLDCASGPT